MWKVKVAILLIAFTVFFSITETEIAEDCITATNEFTLDLLKAIHHNNNRSALVSPVSVYTLLAILQQGSEGNTRQEVNNAVHAQPDVTNDFYKILITRYNGSFPRTELQFATRGFVDATFNITPGFKNKLIDDFLSDIQTVHFHSPRNAVSNINSWVSEATQHNISQLFEANDIAPSTVLVLVNALYFNNSWKYPLDDIGNKTFSPSIDVEIQVPTMSQVQGYHAGKCEYIGAKYVHLDFVTRCDFTVLLVLPTERYGLDNLLNQMTPQNLTNIISHHGKNNVNLQLPKFSLKTDINLREILEGLGIHDAFQNTADLTPITHQRIKVDKVVQKAEIAFHENGVNATAATGNNAASLSAPHTPPPADMDIIANYPFLFFIVDRIYNVSLFAGIVTNPV